MVSYILRKKCAALSICLNFYLGLRIGELSALKWSDIDFKNKRIFVHSTWVKHYLRDSENRSDHIVYELQDSTKTKSGIRYVPLVNESIYILDKIYKYQVNKNLYSVNGFVCDDGRDGILPKSLERTCYRLAQLCDIPKFNSHLIRKTFVTNLAESNVPVKYISDIVGHSDICTTEKHYMIHSCNEVDIIRKYMETAL